MCHIEAMPSVNLRELRNTRQLKAWLKAGKTVELRERNDAFADIVPRPRPTKPVEWPDFAARLKRDFGDRVIPAVEMLIEDREDRF
jgi:antitoxin (DNA-binding transcriptional repressor) of toxin-antitoxin stability system